MTTKATVIMVLIMIVVGVIVVYVAGHLDNDECYSADKLVLYSEQEYIDFKNELARDDISINRCDVINHTPPYIVSFSVNVVDGGTFLYGVDKTSYYKQWHVAIATSFYIVACVMFYTITRPQE